MTKRQVVICAGIRTPMGKVNGVFKHLNAVELGVLAMRELMQRYGIAGPEINQVIVGNVIQPADAANIARVIALKSGVPRHVPAHTVHRNCASGMQAITDAAEKIESGRADVVLAGGVESMTYAPLLFHDRFREAMVALQRARAFPQKLNAFKMLAQAPWKPRIALMEGLTDPVVHMNMGQTAEVLAREFGISREEQDQFSLRSHQLAAQAWENGWFDDEVMHVFPPTKFEDVHFDEGIRPEQSMEALTKLKPVFSKPLGTVTAGNSSQITDGAAMCLLTTPEQAKAKRWPVLGYLHHWAYRGCDPERMGLGPAVSTHQLLQEAGVQLSDIDRIEINEAFATQVLAVSKALASKTFAKKAWNGQAVGEIDMDRLNVHGGAIAMGHPVGMSGARMIFSLLRDLQSIGGGLGLATLCIGGGQGGAVLLGSEPWQS